jgi:hypothetical protein
VPDWLISTNPPNASRIAAASRVVPPDAGILTSSKSTTVTGRCPRSCGSNTLGVTASVTSPSQALSQAELDALATFVDAGGAVFLHDQSCFRNNDETGNLNGIAEALNLSFRFQIDTVTDPGNNGGEACQIVTTQLDREFPFFGGTEPAVESTLSAAGFRDGDADAYTAGQTARIDVVVQDVTRPARLVDRLPEAWTVESDNASRIDGDRVDLGTVEPRGGPIVRTYFAEAPSTTGRYEFGPARVEATADGASATAQVGGTDTNTVAGADQNDPVGSAGPTGDDGPLSGTGNVTSPDT